MVHDDQAIRRHNRNVFDHFVGPDLEVSLRGNYRGEACPSVLCLQLVTQVFGLLTIFSGLFGLVA